MEWTLGNMVILLTAFIAGWVTRAVAIGLKLDAQALWDEGWHECDMYWRKWFWNQEYDVADWYDHDEYEPVGEPTQPATILVHCNYSPD